MPSRRNWTQAGLVFNVTTDAAGAIVIDFRDCVCQPMQGCVAPQRKLKVGYMLPHHNLTGGMKCLVEHIRLLRARGHSTVAIHR